jgi:hypothetical protein
MRDPRDHVRFAFFRDGRLTSLPRRRALLRAACAELADRFAAGRRYPERDVNLILGGDVPDHATLRRLLVDEGFLRREGGVYWREIEPPAPRDGG